jgi:hypothetical protein
VKTNLIPYLLAGSFLLVGTTQAQARFSFGPQVGASLAKARFVADEYRASTTHRWGFEAGLMGNLQLGRFALQPSVLFSQKGYRSTGSIWLFEGGGNYTETFCLNYLTLPLHVAFTLGQGGQGVQVFAGSYVSMLVGAIMTGGSKPFLCTNQVVATCRKRRER